MGGGALKGVAACLVACLAGCPATALSETTSDLAPRSPDQRQNIRVAARLLDGQVVAPGTVFSFNQVVGPRTRERGFVPAPAFMDQERVGSVGGGICQLSSGLYAAVLHAGFEVVERAPHGFLVQSVPPGQDATVWYGKADLKWRNDTAYPVHIRVQATGSRLSVALLGHSPQGVRLERRSIREGGRLVVETRRQVGDRPWQKTVDVYRSTI